jgi:hypothetical protein
MIDGGADASQYVILQRVVQEPSSSSSSSTIFSAMYRFNYVSSSPQSSLDHVFSTPTNMIPMDPTIQQQKMDFPLETMIAMDVEGFNLDMMGFPKTTQNFFDLNTYMRSDWSGSSPADSVYPSPVDCSRSIPGVMNVNDHLLSPNSAYPMEDAPNYVCDFAPFLTLSTRFLICFSVLLLGSMIHPLL